MPATVDKQCSRCKQVKLLEEFPVDVSDSIGRYYRCKQCLREAQKANSQDPEWKSRALARSRKYRNKYPNRCHKTQASYRALNKLKISTRSRARYVRDKEKVRGINKRWRDRNLERVKAYEKSYRKQPKIMVANNLRRITNRMLSGHVAKCNRRTFALLGLKTGKELCDYLESKFKPGMTWDNYGYRGWHVDHIKPLCLFDLFDPEQIAKAFHYTNLQPLWMAENFSKGGRLN